MPKAIKHRRIAKPKIAVEKRAPKLLVSKSSAALVVANVARRKQKKLRPKHRQVAPRLAAGCIFPSSNPANVVNPIPSISVCEYSVAGDATSTDSVSFQGGPKIVSISLVPIFYGSAWLTSSPSYLDVMKGVKDIVLSPYLSQLNQYGFSRLTVAQPVLQMVANPPARHSADDVGNVVWDLIDNDVFPEPDDPGGYNIYMVFYPNGTSVSDLAACGWHSQYWDYDFLFDLDWAWVGAVEFPNGPNNKTMLDNIIRIFSHELVEIITDPEASGGWEMNRSLNGGTEIGDACNNTDDYLKGTLVNAYWSQIHRACVIPKPTGYIEIQVADATTNTITVASGVATVPRLICLDGDYSWTLSFHAKRVVFTANAFNFQNPRFAWRMEDGQFGPIDLVDGFAGTVFLATTTWYEDVNGVSKGFSVFPVTIQVNGAALTVTNSSPSNLIKFLVRAHVTAFEGAFSASADQDYRVESEEFRYEQAYYDALKACWDRIRSLTHRALRRVLPIGPGDPPWIWEDSLSPWVESDRLAKLAEVASSCAAIQRSNPTLAHDLRTQAAVIGGVPVGALMPTQVSRGVLR